MKKMTLLSILLLGSTFHVSLFSQSQYVAENYPSGQLMTEGETVEVNCAPNLVVYNGKDATVNIPTDQENTVQTGQNCTVKHGNWTHYYKNGQTALQAEYAQGVKTGIWKRFDAQGNVTEVINYATGEASFYYPNGQLAQQGTLTATDHKDGEWKGWYQDGSLMYEGTFVNGQTLSIQHYPKN